jgi:hypothetical protein
MVRIVTCLKTSEELSDAIETAALIATRLPNDFFGFIGSSDTLSFVKSSAPATRSSFECLGISQKSVNIVMSSPTIRNYLQSTQNIKWETSKKEEDKWQHRNQSLRMQLLFLSISQKILVL